MFLLFCFCENPLTNKNCINKGKNDYDNYMVKFALNQNTCNELDLLDFIAFSKEFDGIEINFEKLNEILSKRTTIQEILELLEVYDLQAISIFGLEDFSLSSERDYKLTILPKMRIMMNYLNKLESDLLLVSPSFFDETLDPRIIPKRRIINKTRKRLHHISKIAFKNDIKIGFEFLNYPESSISTLSDTKIVIEALEGVENVGYVIDLFHLYKSNENFKALNDINDNLFLIQLSDVKDPDKKGEDLKSDLDRMIPGEGDLDFKEMFEFFRKIRYRNLYSIELSDKNCQEKILGLAIENLKNLTHKEYEF